MLELIDNLAAGWRPRAPDAELGMGRAMRELAGSGLWGLGLPEGAGGGGADHCTTQLAIARVSSHWPALGLGMADLHAAAVAFGSPTPPGLIAECTRSGLPVAVVEGADGPAGAGGVAGTDGDVIRVERVDVGAVPCDLVLLRGSRCCAVRAAAVTFGAPYRRTGLDGAVSVPASVHPDACEELPQGIDTAADPVRATLYAGTLAVAAGLVRAASEQARAYAAGRVQFGAPLTALPTMRDQLAALHGHAVGLLASALCPASSILDASVALRDGLDRAVDAAGAALQCFGGYGYLEEYPAAGLFRDAVSLRAAACVDATARRVVARTG
jgi:alkylation response protein AidB-like acyl-CoA dehydrogenase